MCKATKFLHSNAKLEEDLANYLKSKGRQEEATEAYIRAKTFYRAAHLAAGVCEG